ncbi:hypothetical protein [Streptomyces sp. cmx-4-25]|uniref:hypothetical protein n=1 Tax=unclassified Streptomyces TaxID=2593676 RepID=UPI00397FED24
MERNTERNAEQNPERGSGRNARPTQRALVVLLLTALLAAGAWAVWLGWDQHYDQHPDGSVSGPYGAWQVVGLVLTLGVPVCWAAARGQAPGAVLGTTAGLTAAAFWDWSDDGSGLYVIGVGTVMVGSLAATAVASLLTALATGSLGRGGHGGGNGAGHGPVRDNPPSGQ